MASAILIFIMCISIVNENALLYTLCEHKFVNTDGFIDDIFENYIVHCEQRSASRRYCMRRKDYLHRIAILMYEFLDAYMSVFLLFKFSPEKFCHILQSCAKCRHGSDVCSPVLFDNMNADRDISIVANANIVQQKGVESIESFVQNYT